MTKYKYKRSNKNKKQTNKATKTSKLYKNIHKDTLIAPNAQNMITQRKHCITNTKFNFFTFHTFGGAVS